MKPHQTREGDNDLTPLESARIDHNLKVLSSLYMNISFTELGKFLGITPRKAETLIAAAANKGAVKAILDQANELVEFIDETNTMQ